MKENNHICIEYDIPKTPCAFHLSFVKEKQQMLKKSNIPSPPTMLYYSCHHLSVISVIGSKKYPLKICAIGNCSAETFGCSIEVLIP